MAAARDSILTIDNLVKRNLPLVKSCCLCCCDEETMDHLLLYCKFANALWSEVFLMFGIQWMMSRTVVSLLCAWENYLGIHPSSIWNMVPACLMWLIWRERNTLTFEDVEKSVDLLKSLLVGTLFGWSHIWGFTQCISVFDFLQSVFVSLWFFFFGYLFQVQSVHHCEHDVLFINEIFITYQKKSYSLHGGKGNLLISQVVNFSSSATKILYSFPLIFYH